MRAEFLAAYVGNTRAAYELDLELLWRWCADQPVDPLEITRVQIEQFARYLRDARGNSISTIRRRMAAIRRCYALAVADQLIPASPAQFARLPRTYRSREPAGTFLDRYELAGLLAAGRRSRAAEAALVAALGLLGMRVSEACTLEVADIHHSQDGHRVVRFIAKGGARASLPLPIPVARLLDAAAGDRDTGPLLRRSDDSPYNRRAAARVIARLARAAGIDRPVTPHDLRRSFVSGCLDAGIALRDVQTAARHADPRMTMRYDRARYNLDRSATYMFATYIAGAA